MNHERSRFLRVVVALLLLIAVGGCVPPVDPPSTGDNGTTPDPNSTTSAGPLFTTVVPTTEALPFFFFTDPPAPGLVLPIDPLDWPSWRGPEQNGISREVGLIDDFDPRGGEGSNVLWERDDLGGRSTPIVMGGKLFTILRADPGQETEGERVVCLDAATGETLWENRFNVWLSDVPDTRVGWSSVVGDPATGHVFALGVCGLFQCIDGATGETLWSVPLHERFGALSTYGGRTNFPVLCDDLAIISAVVIGWGEMAKPTHRFIAFDKETGEVVWIEGTRPLPYDTTYSTPTVAVVNQQKQLIFGSGDGAIWGLQPRTGAALWQVRMSRRGINVSPTVVGDLVYASHGEENITGTAMGAVALIDATGSGDVTETNNLWRHEEFISGKTAPLVVDGRLYLIDDRGKLYVLDAESGETMGDRVNLGTMMRASPIYADGKIYVLEANGRWYIFRPTDKGVEIVSRGRMIRGDECHASPIVSHGRVYIETTGRLLCLADPTKESGAVERPALAEEPPIEEDQEPALVQVVPADLLLRPGQGQQFRVRLFNSRGQLLEESEVEAEFSIEGAGEMGDDGFYLAPYGTQQHSSVKVTATLGDLSGEAHIRIVPPLPWSFDFEEIAIDEESGRGQPSVTWVGARYRHIIRDIDGNQVMVKITTIPKGARSRCWFGQPDLSEYTMQADVMGAMTDEKMPDIGLLAQGYCLDLGGAYQQLQIRSWGPQLRMATTIDFDWVPDRWYTMKFRVSVVEGVAMLHGKVWPREEAEPDQWTIEASDASPNLSGSPGLFGNAKDAEIFLDNIRVDPNE